MKKIITTIFHELKEHIPFTIIATIIAVSISLIVIRTQVISSIIPIFYIFHPLHLFFSTLVSTAMFYNYKKKILPSILVGITTSLVIGSLSDIIFPYIGAILFQIPISFHLPELEIPLIILASVLAGASLGIIIKKTKFSHFLHVFISVFASLFYIFAYSSNWNILNLFFIIIITSISVVVPCCLGDIVFPLLIKEKIDHKH
jgi:hypothetical protein